MTKFSVFMPLQGIALRTAGYGTFFKGLQNYMENKNDGIDNKIIHSFFNKHKAYKHA